MILESIVLGRVSEGVFSGWLRNRTGTGNQNRRNRFPKTESGTGTAGTVFQEPKPNQNRAFLLNCNETHRKNKFLQRDRRNWKPETAQTVPPPNRNRNGISMCLCFGRLCLLCGDHLLKGPSRTKNTTATQNIVNYYAVPFYFYAPHIYYAVDPS